MWLMLAACGGDDIECPKGYREVDRTCIPIDDTDPVVPAPNLVVTPEVLDLGTVVLPCTASGTLDIGNDGEADLDIVDLSFASEFGDLALDPATVPTLPLTLAPGEHHTLGFVLSGEAARSDTGQLTLVTSDPDAPPTFEQTGALALQGERTETLVAPLPIADVLMVVDTSCSMYDDNIDDVTLGVPDLLQTLDEAADWQLAVVSGPDGCINVPLVTDSSAATAQAIVDSIFVYPQHAYSEALFGLASLAMQKLSGCNAGMIRQGGQLHLIVVSDEPEQSYTSWVDWIEVFEAYSATFVVSAVVDVNQSCGAGGDGYTQAAAATNGVVLDVCQPSWGGQLSSIVDAIDEGVVAPIALEDVPLESSLHVSVGGVEVDSFHYNASANTIEDIEPPPTPGEDIEIRYGVPGTCD